MTNVILHSNLAKAALHLRKAPFQRAYLLWAELRSLLGPNAWLPLDDLLDLFSDVFPNKYQLKEIISAGEGFFFKSGHKGDVPYISLIGKDKVAASFGFPYAGRAIYVPKDHLWSGIKMLRASLLEVAMFHRLNKTIARDTIEDETNVSPRQQRRYQEGRKRKYNSAEERWIDKDGNGHDTRQLPNTYQPLYSPVYTGRFLDRRGFVNTTEANVLAPKTFIVGGERIKVTCKRYFQREKEAKSQARARWMIGGEIEQVPVYLLSPQIIEHPQAGWDGYVRVRYDGTEFKMGLNS